MFKRVALIHTVRSVLESFEPLLRASVTTELKVHNLLDDFLASDPADTGTFSETNRERLANDIKNAELTGADVIVVTCSTMSPALSVLRSSFKTPIVAIDDAMCRLAARHGPRVTVLATAQSTVEPTTAKLRHEAELSGVRLELTVVVCDDAYVAIKRGDKAGHDSIVESAALEIRDQDAIVLAQASMSHLEDSVARICSCPVFSSLSLCIAEVKELLG